MLIQLDNVIEPLDFETAVHFLEEEDLITDTLLGGTSNITELRYFL
jgi:hypothetical protein